MLIILHHSILTNQLKHLPHLAKLNRNHFIILMKGAQLKISTRIKELLFFSLFESIITIVNVRKDISHIFLTYN